jgi:hypothetical protein
MGCVNVTIFEILFQSIGEKAYNYKIFSLLKTASKFDRKKLYSNGFNGLCQHFLFLYQSIGEKAYNYKIFSLLKTSSKFIAKKL